jgi:hypothetical protein
MILKRIGRTPTLHAPVSEVAEEHVAIVLGNLDDMRSPSLQCLAQVVVPRTRITSAINS